MTINYQYHEGSQPAKPHAIDTESSKTIVYLRKNIEQITRTDEQSGEDINLWGYEEATLPIDEYEVYKSEAAARLSAKVADDNISIMEAITETYEQLAVTQENQSITMSAIADLYDAISTQ